MADDTPLISVERLAARLDDAHTRIADVRWYLGDAGRGRREYAEGHIPGAVFVDLDTDLAAPTGPGRHPLPDPNLFARRLGQLGFGSDDLIVAYDDASGSIAGRLWWMLDNLGHERVALLDGGLRAWREAGFALSTDAPAHAPAELRLADRWTRVIDRAELNERLGEVTLLDARAADRYRGDTEPVDAAAGHIPTAISSPAKTLLGSDGTLQPPDVLADRLRSIAEPDDRPVVASCGSGVTACLTVLSFRLAGLPDPLLYPGSFSDWSASGLPVATGDEPGAAPEVSPR
jgi:thiosulfate/3-mercaptopyruvate sulfurtransferase